ncbi:MAG: ABZJ_00895 family protein [Acinetobacter sp.]
MSVVRSFLLWFALFSIALTLLVGAIAKLLPQGVAGALVAIPYLVAMIVVLFKFLKSQRRAPTNKEKHVLAIGFSLIFWSYSILGVFGGMWLYSRQNPQIWTYVGQMLRQPQFLISILMYVLLFAVPLYLVTLWFYGKQAQRMAHRMFPN